jgi:hypothetical protein
MDVYLTYMFTYLWGTIRKLGIVTEPRTQAFAPAELAAAIEATTLAYDLQDLERSGPQAMVTILAGPRSGSELGTGWRYLVHRYFRRSGYLAFMSGLTRLVVAPLAQPPVPAPPLLREALLHQPDWATEGWAELLFAYLDAYQAGDPVALVLLPAPAPEGTVPLDLVREVILAWAGHSGRETFPEIVVLDRPEALLEHLRPCGAARWVTAADLKPA